MKQIIKYFSTFICVLVIYVLLTTFVNATPIIELKNGAALRTTGERQGIKFVSTIDTLDNVDEHGFLIAKGEYTLEEMKSVGLKYKVSGERLTFNLVVYGMSTADDFLSDLSVVSYYKIDDTTYYSDSVTRNIAEVAVLAKNNGNTSTLVSNVVASVKESYKKIGWNEKGNYEVSSIIETNTDKLESEFIKDLNDAYDTVLTTSSSYSEYQSVLESDIKNDLNESIIYKFFISNEKTSSKWGWLIKFIDSKSSGHVKNQTQALLNKIVIYDSSVHDYELWYARHLSLTLCNFFNRASYTSYSTTSFVSDADYEGIENYCTIYSILDDYDIVKVGNTITLPDKLSKDSYDWKGYNADVLYAENSVYTVTENDIEFVPTFSATNYSITFINDSNEISSLNSSYTIESDNLVLPEYSLEGYVFEGWYEDPEFSSSVVTNIPSGSNGNKVYYAKMSKTSNATVNATYNLNGGSWDAQTVIKNYEPLNVFNLTRYLTYTSNGYEASLYSSPNMKYWYYIPIKATAINGVYEIIEIVSGSANVTSVDYDYLITWHSALQDSVALTTLMSIYNNRATYVGNYVVFENLPQEAGSYSITGKVFSPNVFTDSISVDLINSTELLVPVKENDTFVGWVSSIDGNIYTVYPGYIISPGSIIYKAKWESEYTDSEMINETINYLEGAVGVLQNVETDITLPTYYSKTGCNISWSSNNSSVLSSNGTYNRPYKDTIISLDATITIGEEVGTVTFELTCEGYKELTGTIASSYSYTNYSLTSDLYFDVMDIINCAFVTGNTDGTITIGSTYLNSINNYIFPRAREEGCWVLMTLGPESEWETICNPENNLLDTFADNIVKAINTYGFDGVDLDWECPTTSQKEWFTNLAKIVNQKVKANNPNHLVTAAIGGGKWQPPLYDLTNSAQYLDYINMMTYSMTNKSGQYQSALFKNSSYNDPVNKVGTTAVSCSIDESVAIYKDTYNVPLNKIICGFPAYCIKQTRTNTDGVWSSFTFSNNIWYTDLKSNYLNNNNYIYVYDEVCQVPYLLSVDGTEFISFDDARSVTAKCDYAKNNGLAGVFYWQNGQDTSGDLIGAIKTSLNK